MNCKPLGKNFFCFFFSCKRKVKNDYYKVSNSRIFGALSLYFITLVKVDTSTLFRHSEIYGGKSSEARFRAVVTEPSPAHTVKNFITSLRHQITS